MENKIHKIFYPSECIPDKMLLAYIEEELSLKEKHTVEKHLLHCEFCSDVMEGLQLVKDKNSISDIISNINKKIEDKMSERQPKIFWMDARIQMAVAAAVIVLVVSIFVLKNFTAKEANRIFADNMETYPNKIAAEEQTILPDSTKIVAQIKTTPIDESKQVTALPPAMNKLKAPAKSDVSSEVSSRGEISYTKQKQEITGDAKSFESNITQDQPGYTISDEKNASGDLHEEINSVQKNHDEVDNLNRGNAEKNMPALSETKPLAKPTAKTNAQEPMKKRVTGKENEKEKSNNNGEQNTESKSMTGAAANATNNTSTALYENKPLSFEDSIKSRYNSYSIKYPKEAAEKGIGGTVIITFDVDSTCSIVNRKVKQGLGYGCDEAALLILGKMEKDMKRDSKSKCTSLHITLPVKFTVVK